MQSDIINLGVGTDISIRELAVILKGVSGFKGKLVFDASKPDGTMRKLLDHRKISDLGWRPKTSLAKGIAETFHWYSKSGV